MAESVLSPRGEGAADRADGGLPTADRREHIVDAAVRAFGRWGFTRARMQDIAEEASIPRPHLYRYFPSKDALIVEVALREIRLIAGRIAGQLELRGPAREAVLNGLLSVVEESSVDAYFQLLLRSDVMAATARIVAEADAVVDAIDACIRPLLDYAHEQGELREELDRTEGIRWLTFLLFAYAALPELTGSSRQLKSQLEMFVVPALLKP